MPAEHGQPPDARDGDQTHAGRDAQDPTKLHRFDTRPTDRIADALPTTLDEQASPPARVGVYEVVKEIGRGGMGVVYLARDSVLGRMVALKGMAAAAGHDPEFRERFDREAQILASLNHPNIAAIYGVEVLDDVRYLVLELVEGPSLAELLRAGPLALDLTIRVCAQVAQALESAHERGVIHRDLKPGNIKLTAGGMAKVLDFGIAKASRRAGAGAGATMATAFTVAGQIMGTPGYMSPEQARGQPVDRRTDIWAFGCILFECLSGRRVYEGDTAADVIAATVMREPDWTAIPSTAPTALVELARRCLRKEPHERLRDMAEARMWLNTALGPATAKTTPIGGGSRESLAAPTNLPRQVSTFVGRATELQEVTDLLRRGQLLTLTGAGGCGKTRLAIQAAASAAADFPDGVWLTELAPLTDSSMVGHACATAMGIREDGVRSIEELLIGWLRPRTALIVLDNCEHVLSSCARFAEAIMRACPQVRILATSREALGIAGERAYRVPSLATPDPRSRPSAAKLESFESVKLLLDRVAAAAPSFRLTDANAPAVAQICHRLDGIPLAIELAAARFRAMTPEQIVQRLNEAFRLLTGGSRTALPRQQTLRAMIDWSYGLLNEQEKVLLARLSVFSGGWRLEAAEKICTGDGIDELDVVDLLGHLVDKSLVVFDDDRSAEGGGEAARYRMLETVRQFGRDRLLEHKPHGAIEVRGRHRDFYLSLAEEADRHIRGPDQLVWVKRLDAEHENLRGAMEWSTGDGGDAQKALRLGGALFRYWWSRGHLSEGRAHLIAAVEMDPDGPPSALRATGLHAAGWLAKMQGDLDAAEALLSRSIADRDALGDRFGGRGTYNALGLIAQARKQFERAEELFRTTLELSREQNSRRGEALARLNLGVLAINLSNPSLAQEHWLEALAVFRAECDQLYTAGVLCNLGNAAVRLGDREAARDRYAESLRLFQELGSGADIAPVLDGLAALAQSEGRSVIAARLLGAAAGLRAGVGAAIATEDLEEHDRLVEAVKNTLERACAGSFDAEVARGREMSVDAAANPVLSPQ